MNIAEFLAKRLDEDKAAAVALCGGRTGRWHAYLEGGDDGWAFEAEGGGLGAIVEDEGLAHYIARHDPARVLREVAAKRQILEITAYMHSREEPGFDSLADQIEQALAMSHADHPDYQEGWKP